MDTKDTNLESIRIILIAAIVLIFVGFIVAIFTIPIHALILLLSWNYALVPLFSAPEISFLQSICLVLISKILIKSSTTNNTYKNKN